MRLFTFAASLSNSNDEGQNGNKSPAKNNDATNNSINMTTKAIQPTVGTTNKQTPMFSQSPEKKMSEQMEESKIPIIQTLGGLLGMFGY